MANPDALDIDRMLRGGYGSRTPGATPPLAEGAPYRAPADLGGLLDELAAGGPQAAPISPSAPAPAGMRGPEGARVTTARDAAPGLFREPPREQTFEEMAQEQAAKMQPDDGGFQAAASAQQANALSREFGIPVEEAMTLLGARVPAPSGPNPKRPIVEEAQREALGGVGPDGEFEQGYLERQRGAMAEQGDATVDRDRELAALLARQGLENEVAMAGIAAREQMQAERLHEQSQALARSEKAVNDAVKAYRAQPDVDPNRLWTNAPARDRFLFAMGGMLSRGIFGGLFGRFQDLHGAIKDDIDAQKANIDKRATEVGGALDVQNAAIRTQAALLEEYGDGRAADLAQEQARLMAAKDEYQQKAMELGIPITEAHVQQTLAEFDQAISQAKTQLDLMVASTPRRIGGGTRPAIQDPDVRKLLLERGKAGIGAQADFAKLGVTEQGAADRATIEARGKVAAEQAKAEGEGDGLKAQQRFDQRKWVTEKTQERRLELDAIRKFREKYGGKDGDIPGKTGLAPLAWLDKAIPFGVDVGKHELTAEARAAKEELTRIVFLRLRPESGAATPDSEVMRDAGNLVDGMTEEDVWRSLETREQEAMQEIDFFERAPEEEQVEQVLRSRQPRKTPIVSGNVPDPTVRD
jgi:hypothetical protein